MNGFELPIQQSGRVPPLLRIAKMDGYMFSNPQSERIPYKPLSH